MGGLSEFYGMSCMIDRNLGNISIRSFDLKSHESTKLVVSDVFTGAAVGVL